MLHGYKISSLVLMDILVNTEKVDALSFIIHRDKAYQRGKEMVEKLKEIIPRQMFDVPIQAAVETKLLPGKQLRHCGKTLLKNFTVATLPVSVNCLRSRRKAKRR
jgi:GTP-binding protein LepA